MKPKTTKQNKGIIHHIVIYTPYRINGQVNPNFSKNSGAILDLKGESDCPRINRVASRCAELISDKLSSLVDPEEEILICFVPSSNLLKKKLGLRKVLAALSEYLNVKNTPDILLRKKNIAKLSTGGNRNISVHLNSLKINKKVNVVGRTIIVIDDVTTTGNSLHACEQILYNAGAKSVILIACGKTK